MQTPEEKLARYWVCVHANLAARPGLLFALREDAAAFAAYRGERARHGQRPLPWPAVVRLAWVADGYLGVALYRLRTALHRAGVPLLPRLLHRVCAMCFGIRIGNYVLVREGVCFPHGMVIIDAVATLGRDCVVHPWTTIGTAGDFYAPDIGDEVVIGAGASVLGDVTIGAGVRIDAGAVVVTDVPPYATVAGVPARPVGPCAG